MASNSYFGSKGVVKIIGPKAQPSQPANTHCARSSALIHFHKLKHPQRQRTEKRKKERKREKGSKTLHRSSGKWRRRRAPAPAPSSRAAHRPRRGPRRPRAAAGDRHQLYRPAAPRSLHPSRSPARVFPDPQSL
jgi:hypothetical protein